MYINTTTLQQFSEQDIRKLFPNISFAQQFTPPDGYLYIFPAPSNHDPITQEAVQTTPELTGLGHWEQRWTITNIAPEVIAERAEAARIAAIPISVTPRQIRQALTAAQLRTQVEGAIAVANQDTKDWYEYATEFRRDHPSVAALAYALGVTDLQLDNLWILAATL